MGHHKRGGSKAAAGGRATTSSGRSGSAPVAPSPLKRVVTSDSRGPRARPRPAPPALSPCAEAAPASPPPRSPRRTPKGKPSAAATVAAGEGCASPPSLTWGDTTITFFDRAQSHCVSPSDGPALGMAIERCCGRAGCKGCSKCQLRLSPESYSPGFHSPSKHNPSPNKRYTLNPVPARRRRQLFERLGVALLASSGAGGFEEGETGEGKEEGTAGQGPVEGSDRTSTQIGLPDPYCSCRGQCREETCECFLAGIGCHVESGEGCGCCDEAHCCTAAPPGAQRGPQHRYEYVDDEVGAARARTLRRLQPKVAEGQAAAAAGKRAGKKQSKSPKRSSAKQLARRQAESVRALSAPVRRSPRKAPRAESASAAGRPWK